MSQLDQEQLSRIKIKGYKSIKNCDLELSNIKTMYIGIDGISAKCQHFGTWVSKMVDLAKDGTQ
jgi:hypothetical protein